MSLFAGAISPSLHAQYAHFSGVQITITSTNLSNPSQLAADGSGNIYIADSGNGRVLKETPTAGGYTESTVATGLSSPKGIAVDASGNVYIADAAANQALKEAPSVNGYTKTTIGTGLSAPSSIAVDATGRVYIADSGNNRVVLETSAAGNYTQTVVTTSSLGSQISVALDSNGSVYIADTANARVLKETPSGTTYIETTVGGGFFSPTGIAVDGTGNVYVSDSYLLKVLKETLSGTSYLQTSIPFSNLSSPEGIAVDGNGNLYLADANRVLESPASGANFGALSIGASALPRSLIFTFDSPGFIATPTVVTQGATGLDFADKGTGTCSTNGPTYNYVAGYTCTVDVIFSSRASGARYGAALLSTASGSLVGTGYVQGIGVGPQINFPATQSTLPFSGVTSPYAIATDASGNLYIAQAVSSNSSSNAVFKETWTGSGYTKTTIATGFNYPVGVAVDGAGNVYVADQNNTKVTKWSPSGSGYTFTGSYTGLGNVEAVAVDGSGNLYVGSLAYGLVLFPAGSTVPYYISRNLYTFGIAVDSQGVIYAADSNNEIVTETLANGAFTQSTIASNLDSPHGLAVDGNGNVYVAEPFAGQIVKLTRSGSSYSQSPLLGSFNNTLGVALDASGNVYASSAVAGTVLKLNVTTPPSLTFPTTNSGSTSTAQTVTVANAGNAPLTFPLPSTGSNPSVPANFSLNGASSAACPQLSATSSAPGTLAAGSTCQLSISFAPTAGGNITGSLVLTDNNLNAASPNYATQTIALSGSALQVPTLTFAAIPSQIYGAAPFTVSATSASSGAVTYTVASGPATISGSTVAITGVGTVVLNAAQAANGNYAAATATTSFTVAPIIPTLTFAAIPSQTYGAAPFTVTATSASTGPVTYAVTSGPAIVSGSTVTLTGSGTVVLSATQAASGNYGAATTSVSFSSAAENFAVAPSGTGSNSATTTRGGTATYSLSLTPAIGTTFPNAITFSVSGLPSGATATFSPATIAAGSAATSVSLTIQTSSQTARNENSRGGKFAPFALGILLLPLAGFKSARSSLKQASCLSCILAIAALSLGTLMAGCSSGNNNGGGSSTQTYTLVVSAKDATTGAQNSTNLTLTVQ